MADRVYIGLGSNLGDTADNLVRAARAVAQFATGSVTGSSIWTSHPEGFDEGVSDFANAVMSMKLTMAPETLLSRLLALEKEFGRVRRSRAGYQSRTLDLDIIDYEGKIHASANLVLPHPGAHLRRFVLVPLREVDASFRFPGREATLDQLIAAAPDNDMTRLSPLFP